MIETQDQDTYKIAILGLSNAGKTSIIRSLTREFEMLTVLKPTVSVERNSIEFLGKDLVFWDFGGQENYRNKYLTSPERFFNDISYMFYVVDVQDPLSMVPNISYFRGIHKEIKKYSPQAKFIILFHKADPDFKLADGSTDVKQKFLEAIAPLLEIEEDPVQIFLTSIYDPLSIITAISQPLFNNQNLYRNISSILSSFCANYDLLFAILFTKNFFELGNSITPKFKAIEHGLITHPKVKFLQDNDEDGNQVNEGDNLSEDLPDYPKDTPIGILLKQYFSQFNLDPILDPKLEEIDKDLDLSPYFELSYNTFNTLSSRFMVGFGRKILHFNIAIGYDSESMLEKDGLQIALEKLGINLQKIFINIDLAGLLHKIEQH